MADELEGLEFTITAESDDAIKHLDDLTQKLTALKGAVGGQKKLSNLVGQIRDLRSALEGFNADGFAGLANATTALSNLRISSTIGKNLGSLVSSASRLDDATVSRIERFGAALQNIAAVGPIRTPNLRNTTTPDAETRTSETGTVQATRGVTTLDTEMERGTQSASRFGSVIAGLGSSLKSLATSSDTASRGIRGLLKYTVGLPLTLGGRFASSIKESTSALGHMFSAIKRIALYRAIRSIIKEITQGLHEGISNLYQWSRVMDGEFAGAMDRLASSSLYLKNSLGAMAAPIIQALVPAINVAIDRIVALMNVINMLVSALGGKATYTAAKKMETNFANAASGAAGAAKNAVDKIKSYTIGIDELNIIHEDPAKGSGGGGGGGAGALDYSDMFETVDVDKGISEFAQRVREAFDSKNWKSLGTLLGEKFNELVSNVRWDDLGKGVGSKIQGVLETAYYTVKTADTFSLGAGLATFLNNAIEQINTGELGGLLTLKVTKAIDFVGGFLLTMDTATLAQKLGDFFKGVFGEATTWINGKRWDEVGEKFRRQIVRFLESLDWKGIGDELVTFIGTLGFNFMDFLSALLGLDKWSTNGHTDPMLSGYGKLTPTSGGRGTSTQTGFGNADKFAREYQSQQVKITPVLADNSKELRSQLDKNWNKVNNTPVAPFQTNLQDDSRTWRRDLDTNWNVQNRTPVAPFRTNLKDDSTGWRNSLDSFWRNKILIPVSPFHTNVADDGSKWFSDTTTYWNNAKKPLPVSVGLESSGSALWNAVEKAWYAASKTLTARVNVSMPKIEWKMVTTPTGLEVPMWTANGKETLWGAKGGILKGAQIFGMLGDKLLGGGEAGAEALLPLEKNTGWMDMIATKVRDRMTGYTLDTSGGVSRILERLDAIEAVLNVIGVDTRRTAEKPDNTTVVIGSKALRDATRRQAAADGYSFA